MPNYNNYPMATPNGYSMQQPNLYSSYQYQTNTNPYTSYAQPLA